MSSVKNRNDLQVLLQENLTGESREETEDHLEDHREDHIEDEEQFYRKKNKTQIIETNCTVKQISPNAGYIIRNTDDANLKVICAGTEEELGYLDVYDERFWLLHSVIDTKRFDDLVDRLITSHKSMLDYPYFSSGFLQDIARIGKETAGFGLRYFDTFGRGEERFTMRMWKPEGAMAVFEDLKGIKRIEQEISLSSIGIDYVIFGGDVREDVNSTGRVMTRKGNSIASHFDFMKRIVGQYSELVHNIEEKYRLAYVTSDSGTRVNGQFLTIKFGRSIEDLEDFLQKMFSTYRPFRVWGTWKYVFDDFVMVNAVDLHNYHNFRAELTKNWMRIFLSSNACGNVVLRLFANIQSFFDSRCSLLGQDSSRIV